MSSATVEQLLSRTGQTRSHHEAAPVIPGILAPSAASVPEQPAPVHHFSSLPDAPPNPADASAGYMPQATRYKNERSELTSVHHFSSLPDAPPSPADATAGYTPHATSYKRERSELPARQSEVIAQLAQGASVSAAARAAGIHRTTIHHWQRTSNDFNAALEEARSAYAATLADEMHDLSLESVRALRDLLTNPDTPPAVRLRTALAILERPHFPHPGWHLPAEIHAPHERRFLDQMAAVDADYDILRKSRALSKAASVHHNSSQDDVAELLSLMNARTPAAMAGGDAAIHHNSSESALLELLSEMKNAGTVRKPVEPSRNSLCPCGSGKKYKRCCGQSAPPLALAGAA